MITSEEQYELLECFGRCAGIRSSSAARSASTAPGLSPGEPWNRDYRISAETGLVTSETVPAFRATGPRLKRGGLRLAHVGSDE